MLSFITWNADPVAFTIPFIDRPVRWYGVAFGLGFWLGSWMVGKIWKHEQLKSEWIEKLFFYVLIATAVGARLGHCFFYDPVYYFSHPLDIIKIWEGGLASHGGTLGIIIAIWIYSKKVTHKSMIWTFDRLVVPVGFVAALIRLGNLMNSEVYGRATNVSWAFRFINSHEWHTKCGAQPCHPTQLYEAFFYIIASLICLWMYWKRKDYKYQGLIFGVFMIAIFLPRFMIEFLKNNQETFEEGMLLNMGQLLSIPFIILGIWFTYKGLQERNKVLKKQ